jgi:hypothetical protein
VSNHGGRVTWIRRKGAASRSSRFSVCRVNLAPKWLKRLWSKHPLGVAVAVVIAAAAVIIVFFWPVTDLIASHDVGLITGPTRAAALQTAREAVRTQMLTLGAGVFAAGALVYTARNFSLAGSTFRATEKRVLNERFATAAGQLGDDQAAVRLAGVYAMGGLADDWKENRQTCIDVLCAYLRIPYEPDPGKDVLTAERLAFGANREVRHTVIRVITAHFQPDNKRAATAQDWRDLDLDFTGAVFDGGSFTHAEFTGGKVSFEDARFTGGKVSFNNARFTGGKVSFNRTWFTGGKVNFNRAEFSDGEVSFGHAAFTKGEADFGGAHFTSGKVNFGLTRFIGGKVSFGGALFTGDRVDFSRALFTGGEVDFRGAIWSVRPRLPTWHHPPSGVMLPAEQHKQPGGGISDPPPGM